MRYVTHECAYIRSYRRVLYTNESWLTMWVVAHTNVTSHDSQCLVTSPVVAHTRWMIHVPYKWGMAHIHKACHMNVHASGHMNESCCARMGHVSLEVAYVAPHEIHRHHTATHCNTLQHTATHCNTLQHTLHICCTTWDSSCHVLIGDFALLCTK